MVDPSEANDVQEVDETMECESEGGSSEDLRSTSAADNAEAESEVGSSEEEEVDDGTLLGVLTRALAKIKHPGEFYAAGSCDEYPQPGLRLQDNQLVTLPISEEAAKDLISKCHLAPYGHGEDTIVDQHVRNTSELNAATEFSLENPAWQPFIDCLTATCARALGIDTNTRTVTARLYKLLVYEVGEKFEKHQDSEKAQGMFGSLVIVLPSVFTGGELVVHGPGGRHGESFVWDPSVKSTFGLQYAAFYGDCEHEVKSVTSGYRVCLTYNLIAAATDVEDLPKVNACTDVYKEVCSATAKVLDCESTSEQFAYMLEHKYTKRGLGFEFLKNRDLLVAQYLASYCSKESKGKFGLYLAHAEYTKDCESRGSGQLKVTPPYVAYGESIQDATMKMTSVDRYVKKNPYVGDQTFDLKEQVVPSGYFADFEWDDDNKRHVPYTGNEGDFEEYWYASAALVVRPVEFTLEDTATYYGIKCAVREWLAVKAEDPTVRRDCASILFKKPGEWSTVDDEFVKAIDVVAYDINDFSIFMQMLQNCANIEFQPLLRKAMDHFGWEKHIDTIATHKWTAGNCVNVVTSLLSVTTPAECRDKLLGMEQLRPPLHTAESGQPDDSSFFMTYPATSSAQVLPDALSLSRLFTMSYPITNAIVKSWIEVDYWEMLVAIVAPAFVAFVKSLDSESLKEDVEKWRIELLAKIEPGVSDPNSWSLWIPSRWWADCCEHCDKLAAFLRSPNAHKHTIASGNRDHFNRFYLDFFTFGPLATLTRCEGQWKKLEKKDTRDEWHREVLDQIAALRGLQSERCADGAAMGDGGDCEHSVKRQKTSHLSV
ncbi:hypothetical protein Poli38472_009622 [Pythium oligandrum]|uniref:Fe2OG dioxygenase domain-containing protein n=1 Tax=Pythium oligandrum TaxID=41045 RepID=A0A8K1FIJ1_PYTOL|nr:hypothetical protein Poli38472_009622 [Pythium oligandrum]|eukprot:TMW62129.1 hypothetical protein Poli38472_009622 [Pythium oligandrum]